MKLFSFSRKIILCIAISLQFVCVSASATKEVKFNTSKHRIVFWNVLVDLAIDKWFKRNIPLWNWRKEKVVERIKQQDPDVFGVAELFPWQEKYITKNFPDYHRAFFPKFPDAVLYARKSRYDLISSGHIFLSTTPTKNFSRTFGNFMPRLLVWMEVKVKSSGERLILASSHFDGLKQARQQMVYATDNFLNRKFPGVTTFIAADLNIAFDSKGWEFALERKWRSAFLESGIKEKTPTHHGRMVDHIILKNAGHYKVSGFERIRREEGDILLSDHHMVRADLETKNK